MLLLVVTVGLIVVAVAVVVVVVGAVVAAVVVAIVTVILIAEVVIMLGTEIPVRAIVVKPGGKRYWRRQPACCFRCGSVVCSDTLQQTYALHTCLRCVACGSWYTVSSVSNVVMPVIPGGLRPQVGETL